MGSAGYAKLSCVHTDLRKVMVVGRPEGVGSTAPAFLCLKRTLPKKAHAVYTKLDKSGKVLKTTERSAVAEYLKIPEVAQRLDVSEKTARRYVKTGELPSVFLGGAYRVSEDDLDKYLEAARVQPGDGSGKAQAPLPLEESVRSEADYRALYFEQRRKNEDLLSEILREVDKVLTTDDYVEFTQFPPREQHWRIEAAEGYLNLANKFVRELKGVPPDELQARRESLAAQIETFRKSA